MAYSLELLTFLVVEDNALERTLVCNVLKALGVGRTLTATDGVEAADRLELVKNAPLRAGASRIDVVVSDVLMPRMDGLELVRWIRSSPGSPNPFMPVMMVSGDTDRSNVEAARDAGANEFVAKPVTVPALAQRLLSLIDRPRDFIYCKTYFGPDRRRTNNPDYEDNRRTATDGDVRVVYDESFSRAVEPGGPQVLHFKLPNELRNRVGGRPGRAGELGSDRMQDAHHVLSDQTEQFVAFVTKRIDVILAARAACRSEPDNAGKHLGKIGAIAVDLASQGRGFDYPLITLAARSLHDHVRDQAVAEDTHMELIQAHTDFLTKVVASRLTGPGGEAGRELIATLKRARRRFERRQTAAAAA